MVTMRATFRAGYSTGDFLVQSNLALVKETTANNYETYASQDWRNYDGSTNDQRDDRVFSMSPSLSTIVRVTSTSEKYRMKAYGRTFNGVTVWLLKQIHSTGMEIFKLA